MKIITILFAALALAESAPTPPTAPSNGERYENLALFNKVIYFIEQNYVEETKGKSLIQGAIKGMLETLDPHSNLLTDDMYKDMKTDTSGKYGGLGIELGVKNGVLTIVTPIDDTPAFKAGIKAGDRIVKINGEGTKGMSITDAIVKMRGKKGVDVRLGIWREGFDKPRDFVLRRADVKIQAVKSEALEPGYMYLRLASFNEQSAKDCRRAMEAFEKKGGSLKGLIFDLRNNPGGLLDQAVEITSLFVEDGVVVSTRGRTKDSIEVKKAVGGGIARTGMPITVLVNGASASAAEIVAGALQDHHRAVIMGQPTFGKGSVQTVVEINPDMGLKLTVARYYTPSGRSIQAKGIVPDVVLDDLDQTVLDKATRKSEQRHEKDLKHHITAGKEQEESKEFSSDELELIGKEDESEDDAVAKKREKEEEPKPFVAKDDYQVRQALNYMKSFQVLQALKLAPQALPVADGVEEIVKKAEASSKGD